MNLTLFFKVTGGQRLLKNAWSALCLHKSSIDFNQTAQIHNWEIKKSGQDLGDLGPELTGGQRMLKCLVCTPSPEGINLF